MSSYRTIFLFVTISCFVMMSVNSSKIRAQGRLSPTYECSKFSLSNAMSLTPICEPRQISFYLPIPEDPRIEEVIPSQILLPRCSGGCLQGKSYKCVPEPGGRSSETFEVVYNRRNSRGQLDMVCSTITLETHTACRCETNSFRSKQNSNQYLLVQIPETSKAKARQLPFSKYEFKYHFGSSIENSKSSPTSKVLDWLDGTAQYNFHKTMPSLPENYAPREKIDGQHGMGRDLLAKGEKMGAKKK